MAAPPNSCRRPAGPSRNRPLLLASCASSRGALRGAGSSASPHNLPGQPDCRPICRPWADR
eukprot:4356765-Alexandrium_andersonii.AAC.1